MLPHPLHAIHASRNLPAYGQRESAVQFPATGYTHSEPMEPEDERAKLQRETVQAVAQLSILTQRLEKLNAATVGLRAVARG